MMYDDPSEFCGAGDWGHVVSCCLPPSHAGKHWDKDAGWEW